MDIFPILRDPVAFETLITHFIYHLTSKTIPSSPTKKVDVVVGLDARGFLIGPIIALRLGAAFVPVRKSGKLPGACVNASYQKEYGTVRWYPCAASRGSSSSSRMSSSSRRMPSARGKLSSLSTISSPLVRPWSGLPLSLYLFPAGGSAKAAGELVAKRGGKTLEYLFIVELPFLKGAEQLDAPSYSIIQSDD